MNVIWLLSILFLCFGALSNGAQKNLSARPAVVNFGAVFTFDSTIGRAAKISIREAVKDVNSAGILAGTKLVVTMRDSNCSGFMGMIGGISFSPSFPLFLISCTICMP